MLVVHLTGQGLARDAVGQVDRQSLCVCMFHIARTPADGNDEFQSAMWLTRERGSPEQTQSLPCAQTPASGLPRP